MNKTEILEYLELIREELTDAYHLTDKDGTEEAFCSVDTARDLVDELTYNLENPLALISECGYLKNFTKEQIDNIKTIEVEWDYDGDDIEVYGFGIDGKNIREYNDLPENRSWSERDDILVGSLLMWAELGVD